VAVAEKKIRDNLSESREEIGGGASPASARGSRKEHLKVE
jgi:hypothetical protein